MKLAFLHRDTSLDLVFCFLAVIYTAGIFTSRTCNAADEPEQFTSTGLLLVYTSDEIRSETNQARAPLNPGELDIEKGTQVQLLLHRGLHARLIESNDLVRKTQWYKKFVIVNEGHQSVNTAAALDDLALRLTVHAEQGSRVITLKFTAAVPADCQTIVRELGNLHIKDQSDSQTRWAVEAINEMEPLKVNYEGQIRDISQRVTRIAQDLGTRGAGVGSGANSKEVELTQLISEQLRTQASLNAADARLKTFLQQMETNSAPELEEALAKSPLYAEYRKQVEELDWSYTDLVNTLGNEHPRSVSMKHRVEKTQQKLADTANDIKSRTAQIIQANLENDRKSAETANVGLKQRIIDVRGEVADIARLRNDAEHLQKERGLLASKLEKLKDRQDKIGFMLMRNSQVVWGALPDLPEPVLTPANGEK